MTVPTQLAAYFRLTSGRISQLKKEGMPTHSFEDGKAWYEANVTGNRRARARVTAETADPNDCTVSGRVDMAQSMVAKNYALWQSATDAGQVREACDLQKAYSLSVKDASFAEGEFLEWQKRVGGLLEKSLVLSAFDEAFGACLKRLHRDNPDAGKLVEDACQIFSSKLKR